MLIRCRDCNSTIKPGEARCYACNAIAPEDAMLTKGSFGRKFAAGISLMFFASAALTVASLFLEDTPSFMKCLTTTLVLLFVKSSANQMAEKKGG